MEDPHVTVENVYDKKTESDTHDFIHEKYSSRFMQEKVVITSWNEFVMRRRKEGEREKEKKIGEKKGRSERECLHKLN